MKNNEKILLTQSMENFLSKDGYFIAKDSDYNLSIENLSRELASFIKNCQFLNLDKSFKNVSDQINLRQLVEILYKNEKNNEFTSKIFELFPTTIALYKFLSSNGISSILRDAGLKSPTLGTVPLIRIDRPKDDFYSSPWHQDTWFSFSSENSIVIWIPLTELSEDLGYLQYEEYSHNKGIKDFVINEGSNEKFKSIHNPLEENTKEIKVSFGDILIFRQTCLHKSGLNKSNECRLSLQLRFNDMYQEACPFATFKAQHSPHVINAQKKYFKK